MNVKLRKKTKPHSMLKMDILQFCQESWRDAVSMLDKTYL